MKFKLRMLCPFGAYTMRSLRAGMLAFVLCAFPVIKLIPNIFVAFLILILIFIAACAVYTQIKNYTLTAEEKQKIDAAPLPLWYPINEMEKAQIREKQSFEPMVFVLIGLFVVPLFVMPEDAVAGRIVIGIVIMVSLLCAVAAYIRSVTWTNIDDTATVAKIPVDHVVSVSERYYRYNPFVEDNTPTYHFMVIYLPCGKFVFERKSSISRCVKLVKCGNMITFIESPEEAAAFDNTAVEGNEFFR